MGSTIERVIALVAIGTGVLVAPLAASASPWIHVLIGAQWADAASAIPPACFAMAFGVPISVALAGYLWAIGSASVPLRATLFGIPAMALILLSLLPFIGVVAAGLAYVVSCACRVCLLRLRGAADDDLQGRQSSGHPRVARDGIGNVRLARCALDRTESGGGAVELGGCARRLRRRPGGGPPCRPHRRLDAHWARTSRGGCDPRHDVSTLSSPRRAVLRRREPSPLVSVVTPVFNGAKYLRACIESVLAQTYDRWDYTIVDNCSTDGSLAIAHEYAETHPQINVRSNAQFVGAVENHNRAFRSISPEAKYCKLVSADDWMYPECISKLVDLAERHPSVGIVGSYAANATGVRWGGSAACEEVFTGREAARLYLLGAID